MSVSAIDLLQSSNTSEDRNGRKAQRSDNVEGLFSMLLQKANLQQVASVGLANTMNFSFTPARSEAGDTPPEPTQPERREDGEDDTAAAAPASREERRDEPKAVVEPGLPLPIGARSTDIAIAAPTQTAQGNATAVLNANADAANAQLAANAKMAVVQTATNAQTGTGAAVKASVTETPAELVSQPSNTLSASATVAAQTAKADAKVDPLAAGGAVEPDESMINSVLSRAPGTVAAQAGRQGGNGGAVPPDATDAAQDTAPKVNAPVTPQTLMAATAARSATEPQASATQSATGQPLASAQGTGQGTGPQRTSDMPAPARARASVPPRVVTDQVAVQIQRAIGQGMDRIQIQLRPPELGRIDVRMEIGPDGHMKAAITADRQETLDLLQRDARHLQQSLQDSGLSADSGSLSFSLRGEANDFREQLARHGTDLPAEGEDGAQPDAAAQPRGRSTDGNYDIEV